MEEDQELRFVCKLCNKRYPCGKSLGGHMRSHVIANSAESDEKIEANMKKISFFANSGHQITMNESKMAEFANGQSSYGLRENPRKSWRAVDSNSPLPLEKICKQCGKGFQSLKALCGHMACHSDRDRGLKDDHSWTSENQKLVMDSHSDTEAEDRILRTRSSKNKKFKKIVVKSPPFSLANNGSSSVSEIDGDEQEEVAMCLMLLSRDSGNKGGVNSVVESSDNNSVILETKSSSIDMRIGKREAVKHNLENQENEVKKIGDMKLKDLDVGIAQTENSDSGYFLDECAKAESDVSVDGSERNRAFSEYCAEFRQSLIKRREEINEELKKDYEYGYSSIAAKIESRNRRYVSENPESCNEPQKRSKYECFNCKKTFKSYQALGGHRPCHKRSNAYYESRYESGENSLDDSTEFVTTGKAVESSSARKSSKNSAQYGDKKMKASNNNSKKNRGHVCPFCNRVFKNGQALGGHKRSHFIGGHDENHSRASLAAKPDLLDLNLPAPEEDEDEGQERFSPW